MALFAESFDPARVFLTVKFCRRFGVSLTRLSNAA
jgi:hypothetical protein